MLQVWSGFSLAEMVHERSAKTLRRFTTNKDRHHGNDTMLTGTWQTRSICSEERPHERPQKRLLKSGDLCLLEQASMHLEAKLHPNDQSWQLPSPSNGVNKAVTKAASS